MHLLSLTFCIAFICWNIDCGVGNSASLLSKLSVIGIIHSSLCLHLRSHKIVCPLHFISHSICVKFTLHSASHHFVTDSSKCNAKSGILCAHRVFSGSWCSYILPLCVNLTRLPSGSFTVIGLAVSLLSSIDERQKLRTYWLRCYLIWLTMLYPPN